MIGGRAQPVQDGLFLHPFDPVDRGQTVALGKEGQTLNDRLLGTMAVIEDGADGLHKSLAANLTLVALRASRGMPELADVPHIDLAVEITGRVPTEATWSDEPACFAFHSHLSSRRLLWE